MLIVGARIAFKAVVSRTYWEVRCALNAAKRRLLVNRPVGEVAPLIEASISMARSCAIGKIGSVEAEAARTTMKRHRAALSGRKAPAYSTAVMDALFVNAGVFPRDEHVFDRFGKIYLNAVSQCDALAVWDVPGEVDILCRYGANIALTTMASLYAYETAGTHVGPARLPAAACLSFRRLHRPSKCNTPDGRCCGVIQISFPASTSLRSAPR